MKYDTEKRKYVRRRIIYTFLMFLAAALVFSAALCLLLSGKFVIGLAVMVIPHSLTIVWGLISVFSPESVVALLAESTMFVPTYTYYWFKGISIMPVFVIGIFILFILVSAVRLQNFIYDGQ